MPTMPPEDDPRRRELQRALDTAVQGVTRMTGMLNGSTATARVSAGLSTVIPLPYVRLAAVGAVLSPAGLAVAPATVDLEAGLLVVSAPAAGVWRIDCTGEAWPAELETAALDW